MELITRQHFHNLVLLLIKRLFPLKHGALNQLDFQVFPDKDYEPEVLSHNACSQITVGC